MHVLIIPKAAGATLETVPPVTPGTPTPHPAPLQPVPGRSVSALGTFQTLPILFTLPLTGTCSLQVIRLLDGGFSTNSNPDFPPISKEDVHLLLSHF